MEKPNASSGVRTPDVWKIADVEATVVALVRERILHIEDTFTILRAKISTMKARHDHADAELRLLRGEVNSVLEDLQISDAIDGSVTITTRDILARMVRTLESVEEQLHGGGDEADLEEQDEPRVARKKTPRGAQDFERHIGEQSRRSRESRESPKGKEDRYDPDWNPYPPSSDDFDDCESDLSDDEEASSEDAGERHRRTSQGGRHGRQLGQKHPGLKVLRLTNRLFDSALDYRRYRLTRRHKR